MVGSQHCQDLHISNPDIHWLTEGDLISIIIIITTTTTPSRYMENWKYLPLDLDVTNISISYKKI